MAFSIAVSSCGFLTTINDDVEVVNCGNTFTPFFFRSFNVSFGSLDYICHLWLGNTRPETVTNLSISFIFSLFLFSGIFHFFVMSIVCAFHTTFGISQFHGFIVLFRCIFKQFQFLVSVALSNIFSPGLSLANIFSSGLPLANIFRPGFLISNNLASGSLTYRAFHHKG